MLHLIVAAILHGQIVSGVDRATARAVPAECKPAIARVMPFLAAADRATARRDARTANTQVDAALKTLGDAYFNPAVMDHTGTQLLIAQLEERKGRIARAALLKRRVLAERLKLCGLRAT